MALIPKFNVVAAERPVAITTAGYSNIKMGQVVSLNTSGEVVLESATFPIPYGLAGDTKSTTASSMPGIANGWQNRASDYFDETKASAKMTVYHSGGEFATDQFAVNVYNLTTANVMQVLYARSGVLNTVGEDASATTYPVARLLQAASGYPSGVPGVDATVMGGVAVNGDMKLSGDNSNTYIEIKLLI